MTKHPETDHPCDVCGRSCKLPSGSNVFGVHISPANAFVIEEDDLKWLTEHIAPYKIWRGYNVCYRCWLEKLGVKP